MKKSIILIAVSSGNDENNFNGKALYNQIPANSPINTKSEVYIKMVA